MMMNDFKTIVLPQIKAEIELRSKKSTVNALTQRVADIEALVGNAGAPDADNIINKILEFVDFFAGITEEKTLQGLLANISSQISAMGNIGTPNKGVCDTAAATLTKDVAMPASFSLVNGALVYVKFTNGISVAGATLSVNDGEAKAINYRGSALGANLVKPGVELPLHYNGTQWDIVGDFAGSGFQVSYDQQTHTKHLTALGAATVAYDADAHVKHLTF